MLICSQSSATMILLIRSKKCFWQFWSLFLLLHMKVTGSIKKSWHEKCGAFFIYFQMFLFPLAIDISSIQVSLKWVMTYQSHAFRSLQFTLLSNSVQLMSKFDQKWQKAQMLMILINVPWFSVKAFLRSNISSSLSEENPAFYINFCFI